MLRYEDKILIKNLWECKRFSARRLMKEFPNKNWKRRTLDDFLRKLRTTGSIERTAGSDRPRLSRTADNIAIDQWRRRLTACVSAKGGHFEHKL